eukprot:CAMPEP_0195530090 /NCGR_PEP_ID=MMETSP0794_2-20130614/32848_1 /TAXON_ID=515487 /ORGANISM="Stephanopyxis turris, Strain CCMP 815" /LENGTH=433 /DNA_ID=CAMNT_0040661511 /DNA_START=49 /DNA_END=1350 /DNA_ORIENTATION=+
MSSCADDTEDLTTIPHIVFPDDHIWTEGAGAKWRFVKYGIWFTLRLQQLLLSDNTNTTISLLPNPAQMQNPHQLALPSMLGGMGIIQPYSPKPVLANRSPQWLRDQIDNGCYVRIDLELSPTSNAEVEQEALAAIRHSEKQGKKGRSKPVALFLTGPIDPMHWHGSAGAWTHQAFYDHRLARAERSGHGRTLPRPADTPKGRYVISVHIRRYETGDWNPPGSYYVAAVQSVFDYTPLTCDNSNVVVIGDKQSLVPDELLHEFECVTFESRDIIEPKTEPVSDPYAKDDYDPNDDDDNDARRGYIFRDLEVLGLSDVMVASNSEFSTMAQSLSHPDSIILCPPRRPGKWNYGLPCDQVGTPNSILTYPRLWGENAVPSNELLGVQEDHVEEKLREAWKNRGVDGPLWDQPGYGIVPFDYEKEVEASWPSIEELW